MKASCCQSIELALLKKERFFRVSGGSVCRLPFWKVPLCVLVVFHTQVTIVTVRSLESVHR